MTTSNIKANPLGAALCEKKWHAGRRWRFLPRRCFSPTFLLTSCHRFRNFFRNSADGTP